MHLGGFSRCYSYHSGGYGILRLVRCCNTKEVRVGIWKSNPALGNLDSPHRQGKAETHKGQGSANVRYSSKLHRFLTPTIKDCIVDLTVESKPSSMPWAGLAQQLDSRTLLILHVDAILQIT